MNAEEIIEFLTANDGIVLLSAIISAVMGMLLVYRALLYRDPLADRIQSLNSRQRSLKNSLMAPKLRHRREQSIGYMRELVQNLNLLRTNEAKKVTILLSRAGFRKSDALVIFFFAKLSLPFVFGALAVFFVYVLPIFHLEGMIRWLLCLVMVIVGGYVPNIFLKNAIAKRAHKLRKGLPDALDLLVMM